MQQPTVLQSSSLGDGHSSTKSKAESQASEIIHLKPSQAKVGDMFYRYENRLVSAGVDEFDESLGSYMALYCHEFSVERVTEKGARIFAPVGPEANWGTRPVLDHYVNKFAYPTKAEALLGFIARKRRQQAILRSQIARSVEAERNAQSQLQRELNK